jgi:protein-S-isoprenylcysteine O-methyltransferase Ste14
MERRNHKGRKDLIGEHKVGDAGQALFAMLFLIVWITDTFILKFSVSLNEIVPGILRIPLSILVLIASGYFSMTGLRIVFDEVREKPEVIRKSVFGIVRHPIYLGEILLYLGFVLISISIASVVIWLMAVLFLHYISKYEEKLLIDYFGDDYRTYIDDVPMWIPKIGLFSRKR